MLVHREEIKKLQNMKNRNNEKIIDEIVNYFNKWLGVGYNTENLVYLPDDLAEKYELLINNHEEDFKEDLTNNDIQKLIYLVEIHLNEIKECIELSFERKWNCKELKSEYESFSKLRKKLLRVS